MKQIAQRSQWRNTPSPSLTQTQKAWLMRPGALTTGLRQLGRLELRVLAEFSGGLSPDESPALELPPRTLMWIREIAMSIDGIDCIVARSLTPLRASHGVWQGMRTLRTRPLADILYQESGIIRSDFEVARVHRQMSITHPLRNMMIDLASGTLLARRSIFWRNRSPLLVAECFLPSFWHLAIAARC